MSPFASLCLYTASNWENDQVIKEPTEEVMAMENMQALGCGATLDLSSRFDFVRIIYSS